METLYAFSSFLCGVGLLAVGLVNLFKHVLGHRWCENDCVGPYLFWDKDDFFDDSNSRFRLTFSLMPRPLGLHFGVIFLALITIGMHMSNARESMTGFRQTAFWLLFVALFAGFPYAGGLGIVVGFMCVATSALGFLCHLSNKQGNATLGLAMDAPSSMDRLGGICRFPEWFFRLWNVILVVVLALTVLNNVIHIFRNEFHHWCHSNHNDDCIGPYLIWPSDFLHTVNVDKFGSVFSLDINRGLELWTPIFLVIWFLALSSESWITNGLALIFIALFGAFGYTGNMGVIVGMMLCVAGVISFFVGMFGGQEAHSRSGYRYVRDNGLL